jgi:hypothetical protein
VNPVTLSMELVSRTQHMLSVFEGIKSHFAVEAPQTPADVAAVTVFNELLANDHETLIREVAAEAKMLAADVIEAETKNEAGVRIKRMDADTAINLIAAGIALAEKLDRLNETSRVAWDRVHKLIAESN